jgi:hypothetical protein
MNRHSSLQAERSDRSSWCDSPVTVERGGAAPSPFGSSAGGGGAGALPPLARVYASSGSLLSGGAADPTYARGLISPVMSSAGASRSAAPCHPLLGFPTHALTRPTGLRSALRAAAAAAAHLGGGAAAALAGGGAGGRGAAVRRGTA